MRTLGWKLTLLGVLCGVGGSQARAWSTGDVVCAKHVLAPSYPRLAWLARLTGTVSLDVQVAADGRVRSATGSGAHKLLNSTAEENIREWTFCPSSEGVTLEVTYVFRFEGQGQNEQSPPRVLLDLPNRVEIIAHPPVPGGY